MDITCGCGGVTCLDACSGTVPRLSAERVDCMEWEEIGGREQRSTLCSLKEAQGRQDAVLGAERGYQVGTLSAFPLGFVVGSGGTQVGYTVKFPSWICCR